MTAHRASSAKRKVKRAKKREGERLMSTEFASADLTIGQVNAVVKKLGGHEGTLRFLRGKIVVAEPERKWREDGIIYFSVTSNGLIGEEWITHLETRGLRVSDYAKSVLRSPDFKPTKGVVTEIAVLKGMLFEDSNRITKKIRAFAGERKFSTPNAEVACLVRDMFSDEEIQMMGLVWIVTMHEPIKDSDGYPGLLSANRNDVGPQLDAYYGYPDDGWGRECGFAFAVSQVALGTQVA